MPLFILLLDESDTLKYYLKKPEKKFKKKKPSMNKRSAKYYNIVYEHLNKFIFI